MNWNPKNKKRLVAATAGILTVALGVGIWAGVRGGSEPVGVYPFTTVGMTEFWGDSKESYGPVTTDKIQTVFLSDTQTVTEILVSQGDTVKKGDLLMTFDTTLSELELERKRLAVEKLKLELTDAQNYLAEINGMKPMQLPNFDDTPGDSTEEMGTELTQNYLISDNPDYDGSTPETALICWLKDTTAIDDLLLEDIRLQAQAIREANQPTEPTTEPTTVPTTETTVATEPATKPTTDPTTDPTTGTTEGTGTDGDGTDVDQEGTGGGTDTGTETGDGSGTGTGTETGDGSGTGTGTETGDGSGTGTGTETGGGSGTGTGTETGGGSGTGTGTGTGGGNGTGTGTGTGNGSGTEAGMDTGKDDGTGNEDDKTGEDGNESPANDSQVQKPEENGGAPAEQAGSDLDGAGTQETVRSHASAAVDPTQSGETPTEETKPAVVVTDYYVVFKVTQGNMSLGAKTVWQGIHVLNNNSMQFFDATYLPDYTLMDEEGEAGMDIPDFDFGSGFTAEQIAQMRSEQQKKIKDLEFQIKMAEADYKIKQTEFNDGHVYSDIDGEVISVLTEEEARDTKSPLIKVSGGGGFYVQGTVNELDKENLRIGQEVTISDWDTGATYTGTVQSIGDFPSGESNWNGMDNPNSSYYPFTAFVDGSADLQEGRYVSMTYTTGSGESGIYLENPFLRTEQGKSYVFVRGKNDRLEKRYVTVGKSLWGSYTEIRSGLSETDYIAFPYGKNVKEGAPTVEGDRNDLYNY